MSLVTPHTWTAGETVTAAKLATGSDGITQLQGGAPAAGALDFAQLIQIVAQSLTNVTWTAVTFTSEGVDAAGGHSNVTNPSRYTAAHTGWYQVNGGVAFAFNATGVRACRLAVNGTALAGMSRDAAAVLVYGNAVTISRLVYLTAGQYIELQAFQSSGGALNTSYVADNDQSFLELRWCHS